jgi:hypothetical protein
LHLDFSRENLKRLLKQKEEIANLQETGHLRASVSVVGLCHPITHDAAMSAITA